MNMAGGDNRGVLNVASFTCPPVPLMSGHLSCTGPEGVRSWQVLLYKYTFIIQQSFNIIIIFPDYAFIKVIGDFSRPPHEEKYSK